MEPEEAMSDATFASSGRGKVACRRPLTGRDGPLTGRDGPLTPLLPPYSLIYSPLRFPPAFASCTPPSASYVSPGQVAESS